MTRTAFLPLATLLFAACAGEPATPLAPAEDATSSRVVGPHGTGAPHSITFHSDRAGNREIYRMNPDGSDVERVTYRPGTLDFYPDISRNGKEIVFTSTVGSGPGDIYLISTDGGEATNLTNTATASEDWARWSPNGQQIAFHSNRDGDFEIYILDLRDGSLTRLTNYPGVDMWPEWSPDGQQIAFRRDMDVFVMDLHNRSVTRLTTHWALDQMAAWSPNGKQLAFMSFREGYCSVFVMNADGSGQVNLTPKGAGDANSAWCSRAPSWTRDGQILFMSMRPGTLGTAIFMMNEDGSGLTLLTDAAGEDGGPTAR